MDEIVLLALILLPVLGGGCFFFLPALKSPGARKIWLCVVLGLTAALSAYAAATVEGTFMLWQFTDGISFGLFADGLSKVFFVLFSFMWLLVGIYSLEYMEHEEHQERYYGFYLMTLGSLIGITVAKNIVTLYLFYEFMTLLSLPMVLHNQTPEAKRAGLKYLFYSVAGAFLALGGIFFLYYLTGAMEFAPGGSMDGARAAQSVGLCLPAVLAVIIGFGTKSGMFPMQSWLPAAHPVAPAPASAVLSGVITKVGSLAIIRAVFYMVGADFLRGTWVQTVWLTLTLITVFMGSMLAYLEKGFKKRLAFSTVSQISYVLFGLATLHPLGLLGALLHMVFHSLVKNTLFLSAGAVIHQTGRTQVAELAGIGKEMPVTMWCFMLVSITLVGIPPTSAFLSKWYLAQGALSGAIPAVFRYGGPAVLLLSALLTAGYLVTISMRAFLPGADYDYAHLKKREAGLCMTVPMVILTIASVGLGIYVTPLMDILNRIVGSVL